MAEKDKIVGVIGGMGPAATVDFMSRVLANTPADSDQEHVRMIVDHNPRVPSRQHALRGDGDDPGRSLAAMARRLQSAGADFLVMPCNSAHAWQRDIEAASDIPFVSIIDESVACAVSRSDRDSAIGLITTPGCSRAGLYQRAITDRSRPLIEHSTDELDVTMQYIDRIKQGDLSSEVKSGLKDQADRLIDRGARVVIAACTELPMVLNESMFDVAFISSTDALAKKAVAIATGKDKKYAPD